MTLQAQARPSEDPLQPQSGVEAAPSGLFQGTHADQDRLFVALLILIPTLGLGLPALLGRPVIPGDDRFQNFPLRVLAGRLLRSGHLPLWNRWIWSGSPLLAGFNAGALYPGIFLFALSETIAWPINEIAVYAVAGVGLYALLRHHRLIPIAALVGAATGTFAGCLAVHLCNMGLVEGLCWAPWVLLALDHLQDEGRSHWRWWAVLAFAAGMVFLAGEPRAISNVAITAAIYFVGLLWRARRRWRLLLATATAAAMAVGVGAAQLLPGFAFLAASQRDKVPYDFFGLGTEDIRFWPLQLVPYLFGDYHYSLFVTRAVSLGYVGLLPLVALVTLPYWRRRKGGMEWIWLAMFVIGVVLALGQNTPLGPLLYRIPFYGGQRMQYRNMGIASLGLAGLLACWTDAVLGERAWRSRAERWLAMLPPLAAIGVVVFRQPWVHSLSDPPGVWVRLVADVSPRYLVATVILAVLAGGFVLAWERLKVGSRSWALLAVVGFDLGLGLSQQDFDLIPFKSFLEAPPVAARIAELLGKDGRYAVYDPSHRIALSHLATVLGPDVAGLHDLASVQGFGSLVDSRYLDETDIHFIGNLDPDVLDGEVGDELDLRLLLTPRSYLSHNSRATLPGDPDLEAALVAPHWTEIEAHADLRMFVNNRTMGRVWLEPAGDRVAAKSEGSPAEAQDEDDEDDPVPGLAPTGSTASAVHIGDDDSETDQVASPVPATLVRSVAYADGWVVRLRSTDGSVHDLPSVRRGMVQGVQIPAGTFTVEWSYSPPWAVAGIALSVLASLALAGLLAALALVRPGAGS